MLREIGEVGLSLLFSGQAILKKIRLKATSRAMQTPPQPLPIAMGRGEGEGMHGFYP
jgi:hypothetical protein